MNLRTWTVKTKLYAAFTALALLVALVSVSALQALDDANRNLTRFVDGVNARAQLAEQVRAAMDSRAIARATLLVNTPADLDMEKSAVYAAHAEVKTRLDQLKALVAAPGWVRARPGRPHRPDGAALRPNDAGHRRAGAAPATGRGHCQDEQQCGRCWPS